jgi:hypothetical protein
MHQPMDNAQHENLATNTTLPQSFREFIIFGTSPFSLHYTPHEWAQHLEFTFKHGERVCCTVQQIYNPHTHTVRCTHLTSFFWDVAWHTFTVYYPSFGTKYRSHQKSSSPKRQTTNLHCATSQKSKGIDCPMADTWTHLFLCCCTTLHSTCRFSTSSPIFWTALTAGTRDSSPALPWPPYWIRIIFWKHRTGNNLGLFLNVTD